MSWAASLKLLAMGVLMSIPLPPALERLLAELEAPWPSIQNFEVDLSSNEFGGFFGPSPGDSGAEDSGRGRVCLRVLRDIGNCTFSGPSI